MKYIPTILGVLLGIVFIGAGAVVLFGMAPEPELPEASAAAHFMAAFGPTGYMTFVKVLEIVGGVLVAIPKTRNLGLLILGPIFINILAYHALVLQGEGLFEPTILVIAVFMATLLWCERRAFLSLVHRPR